LPHPSYSGWTKLEIPFDTPRFFCVQRNETGRAAELLEAENATRIASRNPLRNLFGFSFPTSAIPPHITKIDAVKSAHE
jgi:hypothetical protein